MKIDVDGKSLSLPDFLIIGAARSGTTSLYYSLRRHPRVYMPDLKEPFFLSFVGEVPEFTDLHFLRDHEWTVEDYARLFSDAGPDQLLGEASTSYLYMHEKTIGHIERLYGPAADEIRFIAVLRNPVERTFSNYLLLQTAGWGELTFDQYLDRSFTRERMKRRWDYDYIGLGRYAEGIRAYKSRFPHLFVALYEDLQDSGALLGRLFDFLSLEPIELQEQSLRANASGEPRSRIALRLLEATGRLASPIRTFLPYSTRVRLAGIRESVRRRLLRQPTMSNDQRARLVEVFSEDVRALEDVIGRDLSSWRRTPDSGSARATKTGPGP